MSEPEKTDRTAHGDARLPWARPEMTRLSLDKTAIGGGSHVDGFEPDPGDKPFP